MSFIISSSNVKPKKVRRKKIIRYSKRTGLPLPVKKFKPDSSNIVSLYKNILSHNFLVKKGYYTLISERWENDFMSTTIQVNSFEDFKKFDVISHKYENITEVEEIFLNGDKLTLRATNSNFSKELNKRYFVDNKSSHALTLNLKTGNIFKLFYTKNKKKFVKNGFVGLSMLNHTFSKPSKDFFNNYLIERFDLQIPNSTPLNETLMVWFIKFHGIKTTNNFTHNLTHYYPTLRFLRRNKMILTDSIISRGEV